MKISLSLFGKFKIIDLDIDRSDEWISYEPTYSEDIPARYVDAEFDDEESESTEFYMTQSGSGPTYYACAHCEEPLVTVTERLSDEDEHELREAHRICCELQQEETPSE